MSKRVEVILEDNFARDFEVKMKSDKFIKNNGKPAWSEAIRHLIRKYVYSEVQNKSVGTIPEF